MKGRGRKFGCGGARALLALFLSIATLPAAAAGPDEIRVPLVALDGRGAAFANLERGRLEVMVNGQPTSDFALEKRAAGGPTTDQRTVFLIFDTLSTTHLWLSKAKAITERLLESSEPEVSYVLLSLEPGQGLKYLLGPSADRAEVLGALRKSVVARQSGRGLDSGPRRISRDDNLIVGDPRHAPPGMGETLTERDPVSAPNTQRDERKKGELLIASLGTLNTALSGFRGSLKTVYFFSGGIAARTQYQDLSTTNPNLRGEVMTVDNQFLNSLAGQADNLRTAGALLFVVNPAGAQLGQDDPGSGKSQLQLFAARAGGRYFEGEPETIVGRLREIDGARYEVVLPAAGRGLDPIDIEIRSNDPEMELYYSRRVFPARGFGSLGPEEKMRLAVDAAQGGNASKLALRLRTAEILAKSADGGRTRYLLKLPEGFPGSPLEVFRVWIGRGSRPSLVEVERIQSASPELSLAIDHKKGYRARVVIVESRSSSGLIVP